MSRPATLSSRQRVTRAISPAKSVFRKTSDKVLNRNRNPLHQRLSAGTAAAVPLGRGEIEASRAHPSSRPGVLQDWPRQEPAFCTDVLNSPGAQHSRPHCGVTRDTALEPLIHACGRQGRRLEEDRGDPDRERLAPERGKDALRKSDGGAQSPGRTMRCGGSVIHAPVDARLSGRSGPQHPTGEDPFGHHGSERRERCAELRLVLDDQERDRLVVRLANQSLSMHVAMCAVPHQPLKHGCASDAVCFEHAHECLVERSALPLVSDRRS